MEKLGYNKIVLRYVASLVLLTIFSFPVFGQDEMPVSIDPTRGPSTTRPELSFEENPEYSLSDSLKLNINSLSNYDRYFPDYWSTYANKPHVNYVYHYKGLHGLIYKHATRALRRYYNDALQNTWATSDLSPMDLNAAQRNYALKASDPRNPWWERPYFFDHLPVEKGGAHTERIIIGRTYDILTLGPLDLTNSGKVSWNGWRISFAQERDLPTKGFKKNLDGTEEQKTFEERRNEPERYAFGISPPKGNLYTGDNWSVSGRIRFGLKAGFHSRNKSSITGSLKIIGHLGLRHRPWVAINVRVKAQPISQDYGVQVSIALLTF